MVDDLINRVQVCDSKDWHAAAVDSNGPGYVDR